MTSSVPDPVILAHSLHKHYGSTAAVRGLDLAVQKGEMFGLIGPDGAGKTTTFQMLSGLIEPTAGYVKLGGKNPTEARLKMGYVTQQFSLYTDLSIDQNISYAARLRQVPEEDLEERRHKYLKLMRLDRFGDRLAGKLSGGMKQKLALCCALIANPEVLLLDEPTTGVDPVSRREFWDVLGEVAADGMTIVVATPYLDEAERCHRVALIYEGKIQQMGTPEALRTSLGLHRLEVYTPNLEAAEQILSESTYSNIVDVQRFGDRLDVLVMDLEHGEEIVRKLLKKVFRLEKLEPTLENVFISSLRRQQPLLPYVAFPRFKKNNQQWGDQPISTVSTPSTSAIAAFNLSRTFGKFQAVKNVNLVINYGEIFGLLGANGAGKTTTIKMLCGLLAATGGKVSLGGETTNLRSVALRSRIGYMSQKFTLYDDLTILENLKFYSGVYNVPRQLRSQKIDWVLATCDLEGQENLLTKNLPGGWKQRLAFGASVMHEPQILFLDEPTSGVDPLARRQFWKLINDFARNGTAILVTTHYLEEAEQCNRISLMVAGETISSGSPSEIKAAQPGQLLELAIANPPYVAKLLKQYYPPGQVSVFGNHIHLVLEDSEPDLLQLWKILKNNNIVPVSHRFIPFSLEDAFIGIVTRTEK
ncbi:ATP-binding cassette domain-containing protein [Gloeocapsa sp. PCC 73106]|uniref:ATP-binding cassette domain-containing protein n=1 Tax=Gloeocapsa sp. PCC 73106 TaxID=102232 RepID=UPI0002E2AEBE|nr:ATP-binding cassette domain-containing protein [Gloeocapsa sp. PCC 73106]